MIIKKALEIFPLDIKITTYLDVMVQFKEL